MTQCPSPAYASGTVDRLMSVESIKSYRMEIIYHISNHISNRMESNQVDCSHVYIGCGDDAI